MACQNELTTKKFYNLQEAAAALEIGAATLRKLVEAGRVPCALNRGRFYRFSRAEIERIANGEIKISTRRKTKTNKRDQSKKSRLAGNKTRRNAKQNQKD